MSSSDFYSDDPANFNRPKSKKRVSGVLALVATLVAGTLYIQTTLAANISLNSGSGVEFGQGVAQIVTCSGSQSLTVTPIASFVNVSGSGSHKFSGIKVDNIPTSCRDKDFAFSAYNNVANSAAQSIFNTSSARAVVHMNNDDTFEVGIGGTGLSVTTNSATSFTVTFISPVVSSGDVNKVTVESVEHTIRTCSDGANCVVGDIGSGGGTVFYVASSQQSWGRYLEAAPKTWNGGAEDPQLAWCGNNNTTFIGGGSRLTTDGWGRGPANTAIMSSSSCLDSSAGKRVAYFNSISSTKDWYIPVGVELNEMCKYAYDIADNDPSVLCGTPNIAGKTYNSQFRQNIYFTSFEYNGQYANYYRFESGYRSYQGAHDKNSSGVYVRPIRAF